ncbi:hypothetical protein ACYSNN_09650 [Peptoniphilus genitalis]
MKVKVEIKKVLNIDIDIDEIIFSKNGLRKHKLKRKHLGNN